MLHVINLYSYILIYNNYNIPITEIPAVSCTGIFAPTDHNLFLCEQIIEIWSEKICRIKKSAVFPSFCKQQFIFMGCDHLYDAEPWGNLPAGGIFGCKLFRSCTKPQHISRCLLMLTLFTIVSLMPVCFMA